MLSSASDKAKLFAENFSKNSNLDYSGISLPVFPSRSNLKLHNISVTPKMVKKVVINLDLSKASGPDCIAMVVLISCLPELSYILAELFNKCFKEYCFADCWKVLSMVPVFKNVEEWPTAKNYYPVSFLSVISKVFEKLVNNNIVDHLEKCGLFFDSWYGFRSSQSTTDLLTVVSDRIARAFNRSGATIAVALDISKAFENYHPVSLLSAVSKVFEKFVNNNIVDHLEKCVLFSDFRYGFRSSRSTADLLTVVSDRIARAFNRSGATRAVALDISKAFDWVWHAVLLHKLKSYGISGQIFGVISFFLSNRWLRVVLDGKSLQEYPVNAGIPKGSILGPTLFLLYINDLPDDVICGIAIYVDDTTLYSKCDQASDLWQQLELATELESGLQDTVDWGKKWLVDFNAGKTQLVLFRRCNNNGSIDVKMMGLFLRKNHLLRCWN